MGSRAADKLKEIEVLRGGLETKLTELEHRLPVAGMGRKAVAALAGTSAGGTALAYAFRRVRGKRKKGKRRKGEAPASQPVVVNVFPKGAAWLAAAGLLAFAGVKVYESLNAAKRS